MLLVSKLDPVEVPNGESKEEEEENSKVDEQLDQMLQYDDAGIINLEQHNNHCNHSGENGSYKDGIFEGYNEGLSTVIIVKKIDGVLDSVFNSTNGDEDIKSEFNTSRKGDDLSEKSLSSSKTKSENGKLNIINLLTNPEDESDILCELCFEPCENYQQLVRHIRKEHRDCTFVRNYLEEIKTLTFSHCPHCRKEFMAKSSLDAHVKVTHGGQMSKSKLSPLIQKFNINKQELTYSRLFNKQYFTNKINNSLVDNLSTTDTPIIITPKEAEVPPVSLERHERPVFNQSDSDDDSSVELNGKQKIKCDICNAAFDTRQQAIQHQNKVHRPASANNSSKDNVTYKCNYCSKVFESKERLLKHCLKTHFRSIEDMPVRRKRKRGCDDSDDDEDDDEQDEDVLSDNEKEVSDGDDASEFDEEEEFKMTRSKKAKEVAKKKKISSSNKHVSRSNKITRNQKKTNKASSTRSYNSSCNSSRSVSPTLSSASGKAHKGEFCCNLCGADFNRMTLLVTHARYCRQKCI